MKKRDYECGLDAAMDVIGGKWKVLILWALSKGPQRFGELGRLVPGASEKVLSEHLKQMVADEIVHRESFPGAVPRVEYTLTALGKELGDALEPLGRWGEKHMHQLEMRPAPCSY